jgi:hypothetical protein
MEKLLTPRIFTLGPVIFQHDGNLWKPESSLEPVMRSPLTAKGRRNRQVFSVGRHVALVRAQSLWGAGPN